MGKYPEPTTDNVVTVNMGVVCGVGRQAMDSSVEKKPKEGLVDSFVGKLIPGVGVRAASIENRLASIERMLTELVQLVGRKEPHAGLAKSLVVRDVSKLHREAVRVVLRGPDGGPGPKRRPQEIALLSGLRIEDVISVLEQGEEFRKHARSWWSLDTKITDAACAGKEDVDTQT